MTDGKITSNCIVLASVDVAINIRKMTVTTTPDIYFLINPLLNPVSRHNPSNAS